MIKLGTTLLEAKSGYGMNYKFQKIKRILFLGLDEATELKMLEVLDEANRKGPLEISASFCGAHAVPKGSTEKAQTDLIVQKILPEIQNRQKSGQLKSLENIDIFCEKNVFELESTREILEAGIAIGLRPNIHADELHPLKGSELAATLNVSDIVIFNWVLFRLRPPVIWKRLVTRVSMLWQNPEPLPSSCLQPLIFCV